MDFLLVLDPETTPLDKVNFEFIFSQGLYRLREAWELAKYTQQREELHKEYNDARERRLEAFEEWNILATAKGLSLSSWKRNVQPMPMFSFPPTRDPEADIIHDPMYNLAKWACLRYMVNDSQRSHIKVEYSQPWLRDYSLAVCSDMFLHTPHPFAVPDVH